MDFLDSRFYSKDLFIKYLKTYNLTTRSKLLYKRKHKTYINIPISFDIETSSFKEGEEKRAIMYAFTLCINGISFLGRSWDDFDFYINALIDTWELSEYRRIIIYVHNLSYEFQFLRKRLPWKKVFLVKNRTVAYAETNELIFRCSYLLSGYGLKKLAEIISENGTYNIKKLVGDLDYHKVRTPLTHMTKKELGYLLNDGLIVVDYIKQEMLTYPKIYDIPITKTQKVRKYCNRHCYKTFNKDGTKTIRDPKNHKYRDYRALMKRLTIGSIEEYELARSAFMGGFTHASCLKVGKVYKDVYSYDFTSSYPAVMCSETYPMSRGQGIKITTREELEYNLKYYCCLFRCEFTNIKSKVNYEHFISSSKCLLIEGGIEDNGRIVSADRIFIDVTNIDFELIANHYERSTLKVGRFVRYQKGYLPKDFILSILKLYQDKTTLKGVKGKEIEYQHSKEYLNSTYGMTVTSILRTQYEYDSETDTYTETILTKEDKEKELEKYNNKKDRFLFYMWGVFITAYARRNLWSAIDELKEDYIYSDTDSVKFLHLDKHKVYFDSYNTNIRKKLYFMCDKLDIDKALVEPKTIKGVSKLLGAWDLDNHYKQFKTLGAKRYFYQELDGSYSFTISGLNKGDKEEKGALDYLLEKYGENGVLDAFKDGMFIPAKSTQKETLTYIDFETEGEVKDYKGQIYHYHEYDSIHMEEATFTLSMSEKFINYLYNINTNYNPYE